MDITILITDTDMDTDGGGPDTDITTEAIPTGTTGTGTGGNKDPNYWISLPKDDKMYIIYELFDKCVIRFSFIKVIIFL